MARRRRFWPPLVLLTLIIIGIQSPLAVRTETRDPRLDWWREARVGVELGVAWSGPGMASQRVSAGALARRT